MDKFKKDDKVWYADPVMGIPAECTVVGIYPDHHYGRTLFYLKKLDDETMSTYSTSTYECSLHYNHQNANDACVALLKCDISRFEYEIGIVTGHLDRSTAALEKISPKTVPVEIRATAGPLSESKQEEYKTNRFKEQQEGQDELIEEALDDPDFSDPLKLACQHIEDHDSRYCPKTHHDQPLCPGCEDPKVNAVCWERYFIGRSMGVSTFNPPKVIDITGDSEPEAKHKLSSTMGKIIKSGAIEDFFRGGPKK